jgi:pimeloyl-ACP methyl ester carboxylesterase
MEFAARHTLGRACGVHGVYCLYAMARSRDLGGSWALARNRRKIPSIPSIKERNTSKQSKPSVVFAHGLWADGSCFSKLIPALQAEGHEVMASQHGLDSLATDVAAVKACLARVGSPAILVGHSYGATLITHAGTDPRVAGLVYIAALAPDADETSQSQQDKFPKTDVFQHIEVTDGRVWLKPSGIGCFVGDLPEAEQKLVYATQGVPVADLFNQKVEGTACKTKPSWYIVASQDRTVNPELQRFAAKRMKAATTEVMAAHVPMLSKPDVVLDLIRKAASAVAAR